jgi:hypothetical protein
LIFLLKGWRPDRYKDRREVMQAGSLALLRTLEQVLARCGSFGIAVVYCLACRNPDPDRQRMRDLLEQRYGAGGERL